VEDIFKPKFNVKLSEMDVLKLLEGDKGTTMFIVEEAFKQTGKKDFDEWVQSLQEKYEKWAESEERKAEKK
jgi:hypothetical protein